jgi:hypothetical protein
MDEDQLANLAAAVGDGEDGVEVEQMKLQASRRVVDAPLMVAHWAAEGCWPVAIHAPAGLDFLFRQQLPAGKGW